MKRKLLIAFFISLAICLNGCGSSLETGSEESVSVDGEETVQIEIEEIASADDTQDIEPVKEDNRKPIKIAVVGLQEKEILTKADAVMESSNYRIEMVECDDYKMPAEMVESGEVDAALCLNQVYVDSYNKIHDTNLVISERLYLDPLAIFPGTITDMNFIASGFTVAVQQGDINVARALYLLEQKGLIDVDDSAMYQATVNDVTSNPYNISIEEVNVEDGWPDEGRYGLIICDYNRALLKGIDPASSLGEENRNSQIIDLFAVGLVVKQDDFDDNKISTVLKAVNSDDVEDYINNSFFKSVLDYK